MTRTHHLAVLICIAVAGAIAIGWLYHRRIAVAPLPLPGTSVVERPAKKVVESERRQLNIQAKEPTSLEPISCREFLSNYWGGDWARIREDILRRWPNADLDKPVDPSAVASWEEVEPMFHHAVVEVDRSQIIERYERIYLGEDAIGDKVFSVMLERNGKPSSVGSVKELQAISQLFEHEIQEAVGTVADAELSFRRRIWNEHLYGAAPLYGAGGPQWVWEPGSGNTVANYSIDAWQLSINLNPDYDPGYAGALQRLRDLKMIRARAWLDYIERQ